MKIEVLGTGCSNCKMLEENVRKAVQELKIKCYGRIPEVKEIKKWL